MSTPAMMPYVEAPPLARTPSASSPFVQKLCARLSSGQTPVTLAVTPEIDADVRYCFQNVERKIARDGGSIQHGWQIWEVPGLWLEAEFHAVWRTPDGQLVDITPKGDSTSHILFLPDTRRIYEGQQVNNEYLPISKDPRVQEVIRIKDEKFELLDRGVRASQEYVQLDEADSLEYVRCGRAEQSLLAQLVRPKSLKLGRNDPCFCGSGRKYKRCCGS